MCVFFYMMIRVKEEYGFLLQITLFKGVSMESPCPNLQNMYIYYHCGQHTMLTIFDLLMTLTTQTKSMYKVTSTLSPDHLILPRAPDPVPHIQNKKRA